MKNEDSKKSRELPKPIREEWSDDLVLSLRNYCDQIAKVVYPDVTSPLLAMDDIVSRYLERFAPLNPVGDKRSLSLCLLLYPPYPLDVGQELSHIAATLHSPNFEAGELSVLLPVNATSPSDLLDAMSAHFEVSGGLQDGEDSPYANLIIKLDEFSKILENAELSYGQCVEEHFDIKRLALKDFREKTLEDLLGRLEKNISNPFIQIVKNVEFNGAFEAWIKSFDLYLEGAAVVALKYRLMLLASIVFLRIYRHKHKLDCLIGPVVQREAQDRQNTAGSNRKTFLQSMAGVDIHNTLPDKNEILAINSRADELLKLLVGRTEDITTLLQLFKLSNSKKSDFSSSGLLDGRGSKESAYYARVFVKSLASFLVYHDFDYLSFCRLAGESYYRFAIKDLEKQATAIIEPLAELFFIGITPSFVKSNVNVVAQ